MEKSINNRLSKKKIVVHNENKPINKKVLIGIGVVFGLALLFGAQRMFAFMSTLKTADYFYILEAAFATMSRVFISLAIILIMDYTCRSFDRQQ